MFRLLRGNECNKLGNLILIRKANEWNTGVVEEWSLGALNSVKLRRKCRFSCSKAPCNSNLLLSWVLLTEGPNADTCDVLGASSDCMWLVGIAKHKRETGDTQKRECVGSRTETRKRRVSKRSVKWERIVGLGQEAQKSWLGHDHGSSWMQIHTNGSQYKRYKANRK